MAAIAPPFSPPRHSGLKRDWVFHQAGRPSTARSMALYLASVMEPGPPFWARQYTTLYHTMVLGYIPNFPYEPVEVIPGDDPAPLQEAIAMQGRV